MYHADRAPNSVFPLNPALLIDGTGVKIVFFYLMLPLNGLCCQRILQEAQIIYRYTIE